MRPGFILYFWLFCLTAAQMGGLLLLSACEDSPGQTVRPPAAAQARLKAADPAAQDRFRDARAGIGFEVPGGLVVSAQHFDANGPAHEIRHIFNLSSPRQEVLSVDVWDNPEDLSLSRWFEQNLAFMRRGHAIISRATLSTHRVRGMIIQRPRSPQAYGQRIALFAAAGRVVRLTCQDQDDPAALKAFKEVVDSITVERRP